MKDITTQSLLVTRVQRLLQYLTWVRLKVKIKLKMFFSINSQYSKLCFKGFHGGIMIFPLEFFYNQDRNN